VEACLEVAVAFAMEVAVEVAVEVAAEVAVEVALVGQALPSGAIAPLNAVPAAALMALAAATARQHSTPLPQLHIQDRHLDLLQPV